MQTIEIPDPLKRQKEDESHSTDYPLNEFAGKKLVFAVVGNKIRYAQLICNGHIIAECDAPEYASDWTVETVSILNMSVEAPAGILRMRLFHEPNKIVCLRTGVCS
jgi:hypothetical protein